MDECKEYGVPVDKMASLGHKCVCVSVRENVSRYELGKTVKERERREKEKEKERKKKVSMCNKELEKEGESERKIKKEEN